jgi:acyl-CoA dehydrogenase
VREEYGGGGLNTFAMSVILEEMAQHRMGLYNPGCSVFGRPPAAFIFGGSREQIERYAVPTIRDGTRTFFAITEPSGGSDPANAIQTRAVKQGDHWVLNGTKIFISHADVAEWGIVFARSDRAKGRSGISAFIVEKGTPGFTARPFRTIRTAAVPCEVSLEDCRVPAENLVGEEGRGLDLALGGLVRQRFPYAARTSAWRWPRRMAIKHARASLSLRGRLKDRQAISGCWSTPSRAAGGALAHLGQGVSRSRRMRASGLDRQMLEQCWGGSSTARCRSTAGTVCPRSSRSSAGTAGARPAHRRGPRRSSAW